MQSLLVYFLLSFGFVRCSVSSFSEDTGVYEVSANEVDHFDSAFDSVDVLKNLAGPVDGLFVPAVKKMGHFYDFFVSYAVQFIRVGPGGEFVYHHRNVSQFGNVSGVLQKRYDFTMCVVIDDEVKIWYSSFRIFHDSDRFWYGRDLYRPICCSCSLADDCHDSVEKCDTVVSFAAPKEYSCMSFGKWPACFENSVFGLNHNFTIDSPDLAFICRKHYEYMDNDALCDLSYHGKRDRDTKVKRRDLCGLDIVRYPGVMNTDHVRGDFAFVSF